MRRNFFDGTRTPEHYFYYIYLEIPGRQPDSQAIVFLPCPYSQTSFRGLLHLDSGPTWAYRASRAHYATVAYKLAAVGDVTSARARSNYAIETLLPLEFSCMP